jgi:hypothetical protein
MRDQRSQIILEAEDSRKDRGSKNLILHASNIID